jgi:hypothetical protein
MASKTGKKTTAKPTTAKPPATRNRPPRKTAKPKYSELEPEKKRSLTVPLIFIGTLGACYYLFSSSDEDVQVQQYTYQSLKECEADWGGDEGNCQPEEASSTSSGGGSSGGGSYGHGYNSFYSDNASTSNQRYRGPRFFWQRNGSEGHPVEVRPDGSTRQISGARLTSGQASSHAFSSHVTSGSISRGGFGSSAGHFSAGG